MSPTTLGKPRGETACGYNRTGLRRTDRHPWRQLCPPQNTPQSQHVWEIPLEISLNAYTCTRARSIITVNSRLVHCQHVAAGQELSAHLGVSNTPESTACQQKYLGMAGGNSAAKEWLRFSDDSPHGPCSHSLVKEHLYPPLINEFVLQNKSAHPFICFALRAESMVRGDNFEDKYLYLISLLHSLPFHTRTRLCGEFLSGFEVSIELLWVTGHGGYQWDVEIHNHRAAGLQVT